MFKVEDVPLSKIKGYKKNAKIHTDEQIEKIAKSIEKFGWQQPVVLDKDNVVVVGHGRVAAAKILKLKTVPVKYADNLTEDEIKAYRLIDNRIAIGEIDVNLELQEIEDISIDLDDFGLETFSIDDMNIIDGYNEENDDREYFEKGFTFPIAKKKQIISYLKKHQQEIVEKIIKESEKE